MAGRARRAWMAALVIVAGMLGWTFWPEGDERAIRRRLDELVDVANRREDDGLAAVSRAAHLGTFFTADAVIDVGKGTAPITGRDAVVGLATRVQPAAAPGGVGLEDVTIAMRKGSPSADVSLTVTIRDRRGRSGEQTIDAREFALEMRKVSGEWLIARATAVETLR